MANIASKGSFTLSPNIQNATTADLFQWRKFYACLLALLIGFSLFAPAAWAINKEKEAEVTLAVPGFQEMLVATSKTSPGEIKQLQRAVAQYFAQGDAVDTRAFKNFLKEHPQSAWRVAVQLNLGLVYYQNGAFSDAIAAWEDAWEAGKNAEGLMAKAIVDRAFGELVSMHARLGHIEAIDQLLTDAGDRVFVGPATELVTGAKEGLWSMKNTPGISFLCGSFALRNVALKLGMNNTALNVLSEARSDEMGFNLQELNDIATSAGMNYRAAKRIGDTEIPLPAVVHWKLNHYAAVISKSSDRYHIQDPTFGPDLAIPENVLDRESSGYFLIAEDKIDGVHWIPVPSEELAIVYGMGATQIHDPKRTCACDKTSGGNGGDGKGMPSYSGHSMLVSLHIVDKPVGYDPPKGPSVYTELTYNQREADHLPGAPAFFNFGNKWMSNWLSFIHENPSAYAGTNPSPVVYRAVAGGGRVDYDSGSYSAGAFAPEKQFGGVLKRVSPGVYERLLENGSKEVYSFADGALETSTARRIFIKEIIDSQGNKLVFNYQTPIVNNTVKLLSISDALGQLTTFAYENAAYPLQITKITDPFGREGIIQYIDGKVSAIRDAESMVTTFSYTGDFIHSMITPYGPHSFLSNTCNVNGWQFRCLTMTGPDNKPEWLVFNHGFYKQFETQVPTGMEPTAVRNAYLDQRNSYYWDKHQYQLIANPANTPARNYAEVTHWLHVNGQYPLATSGVPESIVPLGEKRVWYMYADQTDSTVMGSTEKYLSKGRVLDDGTTQLTTIKRNTLGKIICSIDPENTVTKFIYDVNGIDLSSVARRTDGLLSSPRSNSCTNGTFETIQNIEYYPNTTYGIEHLIHTSTVTLSSGTTSTQTFTYNTDGQIKTVTNNLNQIVEYFYDANNNLEKIRDQANGVDLVTYTYYNGTETVDGKQQARNAKTKTNTKGFTEIYAYDNLNRLKKIIYSDGSQRTFGYDKLDAVTEVDRHGDTIKRGFDVVRNLTAIDYYDGVVTPGAEKFSADYDHYANGKLRYHTDGVGNITANVLDAQSRVKQVQRGDAADFNLTANPVLDDVDTNRTTYTYEAASSRLKNIIGPGGATTQYAYDKADRIKAVTDDNGVATTYKYNLYGQMERENSPDRGSIQYIYDTAGRLTYKMYYTYTVPTAALGSPLQTDKFTYDSLSRLTSIDYGNNGTIDRLYEYDLADHAYSMGRLSRITGYATDGVQVQYIMDYHYDVAGNVWKYELTQDDVTYITSYFYDNENQLTSITYPDGFGVRYDYAGEQVTGVYTRQNSNSPYQQLVSNVQYLPFGPMKSMQYANGLQLSVPHDKAYRLTDVDVNDSGATNIMDRTYGYNIFSSVSSIANHLNTSRSWGFDYDAAQRLDDVTGPLLSGGAYGHMALTYDNVGNRLTRNTQSITPTTILSETYTRYPATNRLDTVANSIAASTRDLDYDARGNVTADTQPGSAKILNFDIQNRLSNVTQTGSPAALGAYVYNALGQRISKDVSVPHYRKIHYHYDLNGQLMAESNEWGVTIKRYINVAGKLAAVVVPDDDDNDGMSDVWENLHFGDLSQSGAADMDGDSTADIQEYFNNSNPWDADNDTLGDRWELAFVGNLTGVNNPMDNPDNDNLNNAQEWQAWRSPLAFDDQLPLDGTYKGVILHKRAVIQ